MPAPHTQLLAPALSSLAELVASTEALEGVIGVVDGHDLRIVASVRSRVRRRTVTGVACPSLAKLIASGTEGWLAPGAAEGFYLPPHTHLYAVPFVEGGQRHVALLAYDLRVVLSAADAELVERAFPAPAPALRPVTPRPHDALPLAA